MTSYLKANSQMVELFEYGTPTPYLLNPGIIDKNFICTLLERKKDQNVYIFQGLQHILTLPADKNTPVYFKDPGAFIVVFGSEINDSLTYAVAKLRLFQRVPHPDEEKPGFWENPKTIAPYLDVNRNKLKQEGEVTSLYRVRGQEPLAVGFSKLCKLEVCVLAGETIRQKVHIFHNNVHYETLYINWVKDMHTPKPGKYVAVFMSDYYMYVHMTLKEMGKYLERLEEEQNRFNQEQEMEKAEKKREKRARQKEKKKNEKQNIKENGPIAQSKLVEMFEDSLCKKEDSDPLDATVNQVAVTDQPTNGSLPVAEKRDNDVVLVTSEVSEGEVILYEAGYMKPKRILPHPETILKFVLCEIFNQTMEQEIHIFKEKYYCCTILADDENAILFFEAGTYTVAFQSQIKCELRDLKCYMLMIYEMKEFEKKKGKFGDESLYPCTSIIVKSAVTHTKSYEKCAVPAFYRTGDLLLVARWPQRSINKLYICAIFNQPIHKDCMVFQDNKYLCTIKNYFSRVDLSKPAKYVVVFEMDELFCLSINEIEKELQRIDDEKLTKEEEKRRIKAEKNRKNKARKKEKKQQRKDMVEQEQNSLPISPVTEDSATCTKEQESEVEKPIMETTPAVETEDKEICGFAALQRAIDKGASISFDSPEASPHPNVRVENSFDLLDDAICSDNEPIKIGETTERVDEETSPSFFAQSADSSRPSTAEQKSGWREKRIEINWNSSLATRKTENLENWQRKEKRNRGSRKNGNARQKSGNSQMREEKNKPRQESVGFHGTVDDFPPLQKSVQNEAVNKICAGTFQKAEASISWSEKKNFARDTTIDITYPPSLCSDVRVESSFSSVDLDDNVNSNNEPIKIEGTTQGADKETIPMFFPSSEQTGRLEKRIGINWRAPTATTKSRNQEHLRRKEKRSRDGRNRNVRLKNSQTAAEQNNYVKAKQESEGFKSTVDDFPPLPDLIQNDKLEMRAGPSQAIAPEAENILPNAWTNDRKVEESIQKWSKPLQESLAISSEKPNFATIAKYQPVRQEKSNNAPPKRRMEAFQKPKVTARRRIAPDNCSEDVEITNKFTDLDDEKNNQPRVEMNSVVKRLKTVSKSDEEDQIREFLHGTVEKSELVAYSDEVEEDQPPRVTSNLPKIVNPPGIKATSFEEKAEDIAGETAVVVGIHPNGLIVQSLPDLKSKSKFLLLDGLSKCRSIHRFNLAKTSVKLIHVFLKIITVTNLQIPIINENKSDTEEKIERRIEEYSLDRNTWCENQKSFRRGQREQDRFIPEKRVQKHVCQVMEVEEEARKDLLRVIGPQFDAHLSYLVQLDTIPMKNDLTHLSSFKKHEYFMATSMTADPFFKQRFMFNTLCIIKKYEEEERHNHGEKRWKEAYDEFEACLYSMESILLRHFREDKNNPPPGDPLLYDIRKLGSDEEKRIKTCCRGMKMRPRMSKTAKKRKRQRLRKKGSEFDVEDEEYEKLRLEIHNPAVLKCRFDSYQALRNSQLYTIEKTRARLINAHKYNPLIQIILYPNQIQQVLGDNSPWRPGTELKFFNPAFIRMKPSRFGSRNKSDVEVIIDKIERYDARKKILKEDGKPEEIIEERARITLRPANSSKKFFDIIRKHRHEVDFASEMSQIGPSSRDGAAETYAVGLRNFKSLYQNRWLFNKWIGYEDPEDVEDVSYLNEMPQFIEIQKRIKLNESQSKALHITHNGTGIKCIRAGPGSGKTLLIGALACRNYEFRQEDRMAITATTNLAMNNVVEKIAELWPDFDITREVSKKGEFEITEKILQYCLHNQSKNSGHTHPLLIKVFEEYEQVEFYYKKARNLRETLNRYEMLHYAESKLKRYYLRAVVPFCVASTPAILVRHADHYNWVLDENIPDKLVRDDLKHLVVDEASQMPYHASLALMCSFPNLKRIANIGDLKQLGPHNALFNETGLVNDLSNMSELDRINGLKTVMEMYLDISYRSHPILLIYFVQPLHGVNFKPALTPYDRRLAFDKQLPLFRTESVETVKPVAFINIGVGEDCQNESERRGVMKLVRELMQRDVDPTKISIICFHRKQKEELEKCLQKEAQGPNERKTSFVNKLSVHTVNTFQGRENDIIILCTTKTIYKPSDEKSFFENIFQFVADKRRGLVAVSRAKEAMYVFGQWQYLRHTAFWKNYVALMQQEGLIYNEDWTPMWS